MAELNEAESTKDAKKTKKEKKFEEIAKRLLDNESAALDEKRTISHVFSNFFNRKQ